MSTATPPKPKAAPPARTYLTTATIEWHDAKAGQPDTDRTVLVGLRDGSTELGYFGHLLSYLTRAKRWRTTEHHTLNNEVRWWAEVPTPPVPALEPKAEVRK